jgi:hypothetical protein
VIWGEERDEGTAKKRGKEDQSQFRGNREGRKKGNWGENW